MAKKEKGEAYSPLSFKVWGKLHPEFKPHYKKIIGIMVLMLVCAIMDLAYPLFYKYAIDHFIVPKTTDGVGIYAGIFFLMITVQSGMVIIFSQLAINVEMLIGRDLKNATFTHLQTLSLNYFNQNAVGYIIARVMHDTNTIGSIMAWGLIEIVWSAFYVIGVFVAMFILNYKLALIVLFVLPIVVVATSYFRTKMLSINRRVREINSEMTGALNEGITGAKTSKTLVTEEYNTGEFKKYTSRYYKESIRAGRLNALFLPIIMFAGSIATAIILVNGGVLVLEDAMILGTFSAFVTYSITIFEPVQQLAKVYADIIAAQVNVERVASLLAEEPLVQDSAEVIEKYGDTFTPKKENWEALQGEITFKDVTFMYPDGNENVLEHFNLHIKAGSTIAIVGHTGAGKSTLVNLACRFFEPTGGQILIDGVDYKERSQLWLHSNIGYVLQSPHLFSGTIRENLLYAKPDATEEMLQEAIRISSADRIIEKFKDGLDTDVGEGGDRLSTGEKQMISFARAVLADPRIFVLDEATSSIDTETEHLIQSAIATLLEGRTAFLIAHRLSTIKMADLILVVKEGKITEQGTHRELLRAKGEYYHLYKQQFEDELLSELT